MRIDLADLGIGRSLFWYGAYEPQESSLLARLARPGATALDVGANLGYHTLLLARAVGPAGRVVAIEPEPANFRLLEENVARAAEPGRIRTLRLALADRAGELTLDLHPTNAGMHRLASRDGGAAEPWADAARRVTVRATTLDALVRELDIEPDLIKLDAEGAEGRILAGGEETLRRCRGLRLLMELNPLALARLGTPAGELLHRLRGLGFEIYRIDPERPLTEALTIAGDRWLAEIERDRVHVNLLLSREPPLAAPVRARRASG